MCVMSYTLTIQFLEKRYVNTMIVSHVSLMVIYFLLEQIGKTSVDMMQKPISLNVKIPASIIQVGGNLAEVSTFELGFNDHGHFSCG